MYSTTSIQPPAYRSVWSPSYSSVQYNRCTVMSHAMPFSSTCLTICLDFSRYQLASLGRVRAVCVENFQALCDARPCLAVALRWPIRAGPGRIFLEERKRKTRGTPILPEMLKLASLRARERGSQCPRNTHWICFFNSQIGSMPTDLELNSVDADQEMLNRPCSTIQRQIKQRRLIEGITACDSTALNLYHVTLL